MSFKGSHLDSFPEAGQGNENPRQWGSVQIAGYQIECQIGRGGMATVYRAMQQSLGRQVAIKILAHSPEEDDEFKQRFKKEGLILARLLHPNIITIHDVGISENNQLFLSVEYLPGGTLSDRIKQGGLSFDSAIQIARAIAKALGYAHERGIIHRDVKPSNIMFRQDGTPVLTDFGVARIIESKTIHTLSGLAVGSPGYMSPEQAMGESTTIRSDLYSLGVVFYEMLVGRRLYEAGNPIAITLKHLHDPIPELPKQYAYLQPVLNKLLTKKSTDRYKNINEFLTSLDSVIGDDIRTQSGLNKDVSHISVMEFTTGKIQSLLGKRLRWPVSILIAGFIAISVATFYLFGLWNPMERADVSEPRKKGEQAVETLLKQAEMQLKAGLLVEESGQENAEATYKRILTLDPGNSNARAGLETIAKEFAKKAQQQLDGGAFLESLDQIKMGLTVAPENAELLRLRQEIERQLVEASARKVREEEQQQSRLQAEQFLAQAQTNFQEGLLEISLIRIQQGLLAAPDHPGLLALRQQVQARAVEQQRQKGEVQRQEETERRKVEQARQGEEEARQQAEIVERQKLERARQQKETARRQADAGQYLARASDYRRNGKYQDSLRQIEKGLALAPNHDGLLRLREQVRAEWSAERQRQSTRRQTAKTTSSQVKPVAGSTQQESDATLKKLQEIKSAVDALDKSLSR